MNSELAPTARAGGFGLLALGVLMIIGGIVALALAGFTTYAAIFVLGGLLLAAAVVQFIDAFRHRSGRARATAIIGGVLSAIVGLCFLFVPALSAVAVTVLLSAYFIIAGAFRLMEGLSRRATGRALVIISGIASIAVGVIAMVNWPLSAVWLIGALVGVDFIFLGTSMISLGSLVGAVTRPAEALETAGGMRSSRSDARSGGDQPRA